MFSTRPLALPLLALLVLFHQIVILTDSTGKADGEETPPFLQPTPAAVAPLARTLGSNQTPAGNCASSLSPATRLSSTPDLHRHRVEAPLTEKRRHSRIPSRDLQATLLFPSSRRVWASSSVPHQPIGPYVSGPRLLLVLSSSYTAELPRMAASPNGLATMSVQIAAAIVA
ncbi:hypothetical protein VTJ04DRAFT_4673 [Mycothermus thermophilus]|uniref:uncharacterized protein n=1 Tax=Humicola insolens TaxID=85995 RepID=UPI003742D87F